MKSSEALAQLSGCTQQPHTKTTFVEGNGFDPSREEETSLDGAKSSKPTLPPRGKGKDKDKGKAVTTPAQLAAAHGGRLRGFNGARRNQVDECMATAIAVGNSMAQHGAQQRDNALDADMGLDVGVGLDAGYASRQVYLDMAPCLRDCRLSPLMGSSAMRSAWVAASVLDNVEDVQNIQQHVAIEPLTVTDDVGAHLLEFLKDAHGRVPLDQLLLYQSQWDCLTDNQAKLEAVRKRIIKGLCTSCRHWHREVLRIVAGWMLHRLGLSKWMQVFGAHLHVHNL